jgi:hypothetical protein
MSVNDDVDISEILGDLEIVEKDQYLTDKFRGNEPKIKNTLELQDTSCNTVEDPASEFINLQDVISLEEFPKVDTVPAAYAKASGTKGAGKNGYGAVTASRTYKPTKQKWTQKASYKLFMGCLDWLKSSPDNLFQQEYWVSQGIVERNVYVLAAKYPVCKYVLEQIKSVQESKLLKGAVTEKLHPGFVKFYLNCRYQDKYIPRTESKQEVSGTVTNNAVQIIFEEVKEIKDVTDENKSIS